MEGGILNQYKFLWKGKDPQGKLRSENTIAESAQIARQQLAQAGWTELELVKDETSTFVLGIVRRDNGRELGPRDDFFHAGEELFAAGGLLFVGELSVRKRGWWVMPHRRANPSRRSKAFHAD